MAQMSTATYYFDPSLTVHLQILSQTSISTTLSEWGTQVFTIREKRDSWSKEKKLARWWMGINVRVPNRPLIRPTISCTWLVNLWSACIHPPSKLDQIHEKGSTVPPSWHLVEDHHGTHSSSQILTHWWSLHRVTVKMMMQLKTHHYTRN
jgi:hypothetical protein